MKQIGRVDVWTALAIFLLYTFAIGQNIITEEVKEKVKEDNGNNMTIATANLTTEGKSILTYS